MNLKLVVNNKDETLPTVHELWKEGRSNYWGRSPKLLCRIIGCSPGSGGIRKVSCMSLWGDLFECKRCCRIIAVDAWD